MHLVVVTDSIPSVEASGDHQTAWLMIKAMKDRGHKVTACLLQNSSDGWFEGREEKSLKLLAESGVEIVQVHHSLPSEVRPDNPMKLLRRLASPPLEYLFPEILLAPRINQLLEKMRPDGVFVWHWGPIAATQGFNTAPTIAAVGALPHVLKAIRWQLAERRLNLSYAKLSLLTFSDRFWLKKMTVKMLSSYQMVGSFGMDQAEELRRIGLDSAVFWRNPAHDYGGLNWKMRRQALRNGSKFKVLIIGQLSGTFSRHGLHLFADEILPILERELGPEKLEVHIVGKFSLTEDLPEKLNSPSVKLRGWVDSAEAEFLSSDVVLVPSPIRLGHRSRIFSALSCGACVISHEANVFAIPELENGKNALVANDGPGLAKAVIQAFSDRALCERIGNDGRQVFDKYYSVAAAGPIIVKDIEQVILKNSK